MKTTIIIPARLKSTRLERKLLLRETGKCLIEHTYNAALASKLADQVIVATDSVEIFEAVVSFGGVASMTSESHLSGTDRVAEAAAQMDSDLIVNVQGDEPEIEGAAIDKLIEIFSEKPEAKIATLATPIRKLRDYSDPSCVKVTMGLDGKAHYFSRSQIPALKQPSDFEKWRSASPVSLLQHIGIYAYRRDCLLEICKLEPTNSERMESLEQLRFLDHGYSVFVQIVDHAAQGIDTAEDYASFVNRLGKG